MSSKITHKEEAERLQAKAKTKVDIKSQLLNNSSELPRIILLCSLFTSYPSAQHQAVRKVDHTLTPNMTELVAPENQAQILHFLDNYVAKPKKVWLTTKKGTCKKMENAKTRQNREFFTTRQKTAKKICVSVCIQIIQDSMSQRSNSIAIGRLPKWHLKHSWRWTGAGGGSGGTARRQPMAATTPSAAAINDAVRTAFQGCKAS